MFPAGYFDLLSRLRLDTDRRDLDWHSRCIWEGDRISEPDLVFFFSFLVRCRQKILFFGQKRKTLRFSWNVIHQISFFSIKLQSQNQLALSRCVRRSVLPLSLLLDVLQVSAGIPGPARNLIRSSSAGGSALKGVLDPLLLLPHGMRGLKSLRIMAIMVLRTLWRGSVA